MSVAAVRAWLESQATTEVRMYEVNKQLSHRFTELFGTDDDT